MDASPISDRSTALAGLSGARGSNTAQGGTCTQPYWGAERFAGLEASTQAASFAMSAAAVMAYTDLPRDISSRCD